jgi:uncharacterized protein (TIGR03435 family)
MTGEETRCSTVWLLGVAFALVAAAPPVRLQSQAPSFEVTSVKVNRSGVPGGMVDLRPGQFTGTNVTLRDLLVAAYELETFRIVGGPEWMERDRFDIQARALSPVGREEGTALLRALLADRFTVRARLEQRAHPIFSLVTSDDGRPGPRLRPASPEACADRGPKPFAAPAGQLPSCGRLSAGPGRMSGRSVSLDLLASYLSPRVNRVVANRTRLSGVFDVDLEWRIDDAQRAALARLSPDGSPPLPEPEGPGLETALREQLGLKLESTTGPVDVLVVESAERPMAD